MEITQEYGAGYLITAYTQNSISIGDKKIDKTLFISPSYYEEIDNFSHISILSQAFLDEKIPKGIEVLLIGTGEILIFPDKKYYAYLAQKEIGLEVMTTAAACRTYNILMAEDRKVAALLILP